MNIATNQYVQNLKSRLNETKGYYEGEVEHSYTAEERMKVLLAAEPSTSEDIIAFVIFLESINVLQNTEILNKARRIIDLAGLSVPKEHMAVAIDVLAKYEKPKGVFARLFNDHTKNFCTSYNPFFHLPTENPFQL